MVMLERFKFLLRMCQFVGFAPISITTRNMKKTNLADNFFNLIPTTLTTLFSLCIAYFLLLRPHFESYGPIHGIINTASLLNLFLIVLTGNCQCFFSKSILRNINYRIRLMEQKMFADHESKFYIAYSLKMLIICFLFFLSQGLVFYESYLASASEGMLSSFFTSLFRFIFPVAVLHVLLYSDIVANFMQQLNLEIKATPKCYHSLSKVELLKNVKLMHMDIWKILREINRYFGWNLLFLVINSFVYITYQLYWIFVTLQHNWDKLGVIEGAASLIYGMTSIYILIDSCQSCSKEAKYLTENVDQFVFCTSENELLHKLKLEMFHQVNNFSMIITASDFFDLDRQLLGNVFAGCCMYIIIFIQFFLASEVKT